MKKLTHLMFVGLLAVTLSACATSGRPYEDNRIAQIKRKETNEAQLLQWFGPAESRSLSQDGGMTLAWSFGRKSTTGWKDAGVLQVKLDPEGKVDVYSAHRAPK